MAVTVHPFYRRLNARLGNRPKRAAVIMIIVALLIITLPSLKLASFMLDGIRTINEKFNSGALHVPLPPPGVREWPMVGASLEKVLRQASVNLTGL